MLHFFVIYARWFCGVIITEGCTIREETELGPFFPGFFGFSLPGLREERKPLSDRNL